MKKNTAIILSLAMLVSLCACGKDENADDPNNAGYNKPANELVGAWINEDGNTGSACVFNNDGTGFICTSDLYYEQSFCTYTVDNSNSTVYIQYDYYSDVVACKYELSGDSLILHLQSPLYSSVNSTRTLKKVQENYKCTIKDLSGIWVHTDGAFIDFYVFDDNYNVKNGAVIKNENSLDWKNIVTDFKINFGVICLYKEFSNASEVKRPSNYKYTGSLNSCSTGNIAYYNSDDNCLVLEEDNYTKISDNFSASDTELLALISKAN